MREPAETVERTVRRATAETPSAGRGSVPRRRPPRPGTATRRIRSPPARAGPTTPAAPTARAPVPAAPRGIRASAAPAEPAAPAPRAAARTARPRPAARPRAEAWAARSRRTAWPGPRWTPSTTDVRSVRPSISGGDAPAIWGGDWPPVVIAALYLGGMFGIGTARTTRDGRRLAALGPLPLPVLNEARSPRV